VRWIAWDHQAPAQREQRSPEWLDMAAQTSEKNHGGTRGPPESEQGRAESRIQGLDKRCAAGGRKWRQQRQGGGLAARSNRLSLEERGWLERGVRWAVPVRVGFGLSVSFVLLGRIGA
jgi:hypothetical protein